MFRLALVFGIALLCSVAEAQVFQRVQVCNGTTCQMQIVPRVAPLARVVQPSVTYSVVPSTTYSSPVVSSTVVRSTCNCGVTGVCTCPNCNCEHKTSSVSNVSATALRGSFRNSLMQAARQARKSGDITALEFFKIAAASRNPKMMEQIQAAVHESAIEEGLASINAIDWDAIIEFIEKLIPLIIQLIDLFK